MNCEIIWNSLSFEEWETRFTAIARSNILQSYAYARAICSLNRQKARWGLIYINGQEAGLVQILEAGIFRNFFHGIILDRGPLWFDGFGGAAHIKAFFEEFNRQFPKRFGRKRRIIPEVEDGAAARGLLQQAGLERIKTQTGYQTLWWDLNLDEEQARKNLKTNWRGSLKKAENAGLTIQWDDTGLFYPWLKQEYVLDKKLRGYSGPSPQLLDNLATFSTKQNPMIIGRAQKDGQDIAAVMFLKHGQCTTYQIGWSSEQGRKNCAHHLLLWQARTMLQQYGVMALDLGGINEETASGIKKFKQGTGANEMGLIGHYR